MSNYSEINVYDKNGIHIAKFDNSNKVYDTQKQKNQLVIPYVKMVQNGESTLTFQMLIESEKWHQVKDINNKWHCNGRVYTALNTNSYKFNGKLVNATLVEDWYLLGKDYAQVHNVDTSVEALDEHTIKILPKTSTDFKLTVNGIKYNDSEVKDSRGVLLPRGSAGYALWGILKGNSKGWTLGVCDVIVDGFNPENDFGVFNLESDMKPILQNIKYVQELWGGILVFDSLNKIVHLRDETKVGTDFNTWKGFELRRNKNMLDEPVYTIDNDIITKAYILGNGNIHIKDVNNGKTYLENYSYTNEVLEGYLQNPNIHYTGNADTSGQTQLLEWGKRKLAEMCKPRVQITFSIVDRRMEKEFEHEIFNINDIIRVPFHNTVTDTEEIAEKRIIEWNYNVWQMNDSSIVVGDKILNERELFNLTYKNSVVDNPKFSWEGYFNGVDINIALSDVMSSFFGGGGYMSMSNMAELYVEKITENTEAVAGVRVYADETFATNESFTAFSKWTEESFFNSSTLINQISSELDAQILLEAQHYAETKSSISQGLADLRLYVNGEFAQATLRASYDYTDSKTGQVANSLAQFQTYANSTYASATALAQTNNSLAQFILQADDKYASATISAQVSNLQTNTQGIQNTGGRLSVTSDFVAMTDGTSGTTIHCRSGSSSVLGSSNVYINAPNIYIQGHRMKFGGIGGDYLMKA